MAQQSLTEAQKRHERLCEIVDRALNMPEPERAAFLDQHCEPSFRQQVDELLTLDCQRQAAPDAKMRLDVFDKLDELSQPAPDVVASQHELGPDHRVALGTEIGPFTLREVLGSGGMGVVYLADQHEPVSRQVALKLVQASLSRESGQHRFNAEQQAMARLYHPNIAQMFETGTTAMGNPYFAMEYVPGERLTRHCEIKRLGLSERVRLMISVCQAVHHAHQRGIIHRDLKPSNILVTEIDGESVVKVIDFGIAKALDQPLSDNTTLTGGLIGTPDYMSPESLTLADAEHIDTRTDIYALGILLFELLVGDRPYRSDQLGMARVMRRIAEVDPPRLKRFFVALPEQRQATVAQHLNLSVAALRRQLDGDLTWIVDKAIRRDRDERYESAAALAADLQHYLHDRPVSASPPTGLYLARKFASRHRAAVLAASTTLALLIAFAMTTAVQNRRIAVALENAEQEARARGLISDFLKDTFRLSDPNARGGQVSARELLDHSADSIDDRFGDQPEIQAELMLTLGEVYTNLAQFEQARPLLQRSLEERQRLLGEAHPDTLASMSSLANVMLKMGQFEQAETLYLSALAIEETLLGERHPDRLSSMHNLGVLYAIRDQYHKAEPLLSKAMALRTQTLGRDHPDTLNSLNSLAIVYQESDREADAQPLFEEALYLQTRTLGSEHPETMRTMNNLAILHKNLGEFERAETLYLRSIAGKRAALGDDHPSTLRGTRNLCNLYRAMGRLDQAETVCTDALMAYRSVLGTEHPSTLSAMGSLARTQVALGHLEQAESMFQSQLESRARVLGEDDIKTLNTMDELGNLLITMGRHSEAATMLTDGLEGRIQTLGKSHADVAASHVSLACLAASQGQIEIAFDHMQLAISLGKSTQDLRQKACLSVVFDQLDDLLVSQD